MTFTLQIFGILAGVALIAYALRSIVKRIITARQSLFWILLGVIVVIFCCFPILCNILADFFGVEYAPSIIYMTALIIVAFGLFYCFQRLATLSAQLRDLAIHLTIAQKKIAELESSRNTDFSNIDFAELNEAHEAKSEQPQNNEKDTVCH